MKSTDKSLLWLSVLLVVVVAALYFPALRYAFVSYDDEYFVTYNTHIQMHSLPAVLSLFTRYYPDLYIPFTLLSFSAEHALFGLDPFFFHLTNILLHCVNVLLVLVLFLQWSNRKTVAFIGALLFAIHPLNVEAVVWISARKDLLSACFAIATLLLYAKWRVMGSWLLYYASLGLFTLALMSKLLAVFLLFVLLLETYRRRRFSRDSVVPLLPFFALSVLFGVIGLLGKAQGVGDLPFFSLIALSCKTIIFTLRQFFTSLSLSIIYPQYAPIDPLSIEFLWPAISIILITAVTVLWERKTREPLFLWATFLCLLAPAFFVLRRFTGIEFGKDKFAYLPMIVLCYACGLIFFWGWKRQRWIASGITLAWVTLLFTHSAARLPIWKDSQSLFQETVNTTRDVPRIRYALAYALFQKGDRERAENELRLGLTEHAGIIERHERNAARFASVGRRELAVLERDLAEADKRSSSQAMGLLKLIQLQNSQ